MGPTKTVYFGGLYHLKEAAVWTLALFQVPVC